MQPSTLLPVRVLLLLVQSTPRDKSLPLDRYVLYNNGYILICRMKLRLFYTHRPSVQYLYCSVSYLLHLLMFTNVFLISIYDLDYIHLNITTFDLIKTYVQVSSIIVL